MRNNAGTVAIGLLLACAPGVKAPVSVVVLAWVPADQKYEPAQVQLQTVQDLTSMSGTAANFVGGAQIVVDPSDPTLQAAQTVDQVRAAIVKSNGGPLSLDFTASSGVYFPTDFHSWNATTAYYNLEQANLFYCGTPCAPQSPYTGLGLNPADVTPAPNVYYFPDFETGTGAARTRGTDNAKYYPLLESFLVFPFKQLQSIPLSMNQGVMGHEYTHSMVDLRVYGHKETAIYDEWQTNNALTVAELMISLDEGNADLMGGILTCGSNFDHCDTQYIGKSIPSLLATRDLAGCGCSTSDILNQMGPNSSIASVDDWVASNNQYVVGNWFSTAVWRGLRGNQATPDPTRLQEIAKASWTWLQSNNNNNAGLKELVDTGGASPQFGFDDVLNAFAAQITDANLRDDVCAALLDRFSNALSPTSPNSLAQHACAGVTPLNECATNCQ